MSISILNEEEEPINVSSISNTDGLEGHYVIVPGMKVPVYVPKRTKDGTPILPEDWYDDYWDEVEPRLN